MPEPKPNRNVALVDYRLTGHHPFYLATFAKSFQAIGCQVTLIVSDAATCRKEMQAALPGFNLESVRIHESASKPQTNRRLGCRSYFLLQELERELSKLESTTKQKFDFVFFAYLDDFCQEDPYLHYWLKPPFKRKFSGLLMAARERLKGAKRQGLASKLTTTFVQTKEANFDSIGVLTEDYQEQTARILGKQATVFPDFCSTPIKSIESSNPLVSEVAEKKQNRKVVSLLGSIQPHKSVDLLLAAQEQTDPDDFLFVIAGKLQLKKHDPITQDKIQQVLNDPPENVIFFNDWIPNEHVFDSIISHSDYLFAFYRNFKKSSNLVTKGAQYSVPSIVNEKYLMGERVRKYQLGLAVSEPDVVKLFTNGQLTNDWEFDTALQAEFNRQHDAQRLTEIFEGYF